MIVTQYENQKFKTRQKNNGSVPTRHVNGKSVSR